MVSLSTDDEKNMDDEMTKTESLFRDLSADDPDPEVHEITSLCLNCGENGVTRMLLTKIRYFKDVVACSFKCDHCHWQNNELQPVSEIQEKGICYYLKVRTPKDLNRQLVKTRWATVVIPEIEFEIPAQSQEGCITTIEGVLQRASDGLQTRLDDQLQELVNDVMPAPVAQLQEFLHKLNALKSGSVPFRFILRDITGNSFLENPFVPNPDPELKVSYFTRSKEENILLGVVCPEEDEINDTATSETEKPEEDEGIENEVLEFQTHCSQCLLAGTTKMKLIHIPHFKDVVLMTTLCDSCGHKTTEVQSNSGIEPLGIKITLKIMEEKDLKRDVVTSNTCSISIPELEFEGELEAIRGRYTTVEGLLTIVKQQVSENNPFALGDSTDAEIKAKLLSLVEALTEVLQLKRTVTLVLKDLSGHTYLQSIHYPDPDTNLTMEKFERTFEENEELGLNDMKVENYSNS